MKRIQRKRTKGWRMPENAVYVGRPTIWGNPFTIYDFKGELSEEYRRQLAVEAYEAWLRGELKDRPHMLEPLKGKDLACWCPLDKLCHADIILKILKEASD
jgi:hypothetical protein